MARSGPITVDTTTVPIGLAQIRIGASATNIANIHPVLSSSDSIGALGQTKFTSEYTYKELFSGYPAVKDTSFPLRVVASMEITAKEITPYNLALARGIDPTDGSYTEAHSGEIPLGVATTPDDIRLEAHYTFPDGTHYMDIIFPRGQVPGNLELDFQEEDFAATPITIEANAADSGISGGNAVWDDKPLGRIAFS